MYGTIGLEKAELQSILVTAARCADCDNPACVSACPEHVDLRGVFKFIAAQAPMPVAWMRSSQEAEDFVAAAIENSFSI